MKQRPAVVRDPVRGIAESGEWAETQRLDAARVVSPYFRQDEKLVRFVLTEPPDGGLDQLQAQAGQDGLPATPPGAPAPPPDPNAARELNQQAGAADLNPEIRPK